MTGRRPATALKADRPELTLRPASDEDTTNCLPAPAPHLVRAARGYLTSRYAAGADAVLWEFLEQPLPDLDAIDAVNAASDRAQVGAGIEPEPMEVATALVVLGAARLDLDQTEARLLNTAQASGLDWVQIAAILNLSVQATEERYRQLKPRLDEPVDDVLPPRLREQPTHRPRAVSGRFAAQSAPTCSLTSAPATGDQPMVWDEPEDDPWGQP